ncbi:Estrogen sulfotransferase, testis isoform, putative [Ricinus communis]|uniref:Sulfotransferase n=1 Tax=Ricinus communis TaxID=3988 RepID=B9RLK2_RICCO|nr:Estrogen sulfotransferase, testis isoform, putative [Ricinus communis]
MDRKAGGGGGGGEPALTHINNSRKLQTSTLCSFPKTGTTWLKALAFAILTRSRFSDVSKNNPLLTTTPHDCVPFVEVDHLRNAEIPLVATHRNPKDVLISLWYFLGKFSYVNPEKYPSLEEGLELFCEGFVPSGPYWEHVLGYWKASLESPERMLLLEYEEMKKDIVSIVKTLAEFMGYPFNIEEERQGLVQKVINLCSFENLSNLDVTKNGEQWPNSQFPIPNSVFFRKGEIGDWKNHLTQEMADRMDQINEQKLSGCCFKFMSHQSHV